jgi:PAS domain S-box-containing protein
MPLHDKELSDLIIDTVASLIVVTDALGKLIRINPACEEVLGVRQADVLGQFYWDICVPPNDRLNTIERFQNVLAGAQPPSYERFWVDRNGLRRTIIWTVRCLRDKEGKPRYVVGTGKDISDSRKTETELRDQTRMFRSILESIGDGVAVADRFGKLILFTPELERIMGLPKPSVPAEQWPDVFAFYQTDGKTPFPVSRLPMVRAMAGEATNDVELVIRRPEWPEPHWVSVNGRPLLDESGRHCGGVIASRDITERKRAEGELRLRKSLLESQMQASIDGILVVGTEGKILLSNKRFAEMWGISDEIIAQAQDKMAIAAVIDQLEDPQEFVDRIAWLNAHPEEQGVDELRLKDGRIFDRFSASVRGQSADGNSIVYYGRFWLLRDISDLKRAEEAARRNAQEARQSERRARRIGAHFRKAAEHNRRLVREIDHRVGNNLAGLLGLVEMTRQRASTVDAFAAAIEMRLRGMAQVHQLLQRGNWQRLPLKELINSTLKAMAQPQHDKVALSIAGPDVWIEATQVAPLTMVLVELLTNSAKHGVHRAAAGELCISWEVCPGNARKKEIPRLHLDWIERGVEAIRGPMKTSLGTELIEGFVARELLGRCELRYPPEGATHRFDIPLTFRQTRAHRPQRVLATE